jgi:hypothetical protein
MNGAIVPLPNTPSWCDDQSKKAHGQLYLSHIADIKGKEERCVQVTTCVLRSDTTACIYSNVNGTIKGTWTILEILHQTPQHANKKK